MPSRKNTKVTTTRSTTATENDQHLPTQQLSDDERELLQSMKSQDQYAGTIAGLNPRKTGTCTARRSTIVESIDPREVRRSLASMRDEATAEMATGGELQGEAEFRTLDTALFKCLIENNSNIKDSTTRFMVDSKKAATISRFQTKAARYHEKLQTNGSYGVREIAWWINRRALKANEGDPRDHLNFGWPSPLNPVNKETGYVMMYIWMQKDFCLEALLFYNTAKELREKYMKSVKKLKRNSDGLDLTTKNKKAAKHLQTFKRGYIELCREYVRADSPMEINISGPARKKYVDLATSRCGMAPDNAPVTEAPRHPGRRLPASLEGLAEQEKKARARARKVRERAQSAHTTDEVAPPSGRIGRSQSEDGGKKKKGKKGKKNKMKGNQEIVLEDTNED